ncbi:MAG: CDP-alcohol phosphatidyltransferase family protein [Hyphomicrobiales bacterium]|nr:CDP-alcohol phosphatidyltransferase family protein [Hyphomicrobiales bacterium]MCP5374398.1 CDP-alcohol phosphatidyltransferase family protein [Hyphomicrobiales bacterium]
MVNVPNLITLARILSVPVAVWLVLTGHMLAAFWVFVAAGISDAMDGFIAKRFNAVTELGAYLDPLADKALLVSVYVTLGQQEYLATWLVILVVFRDVLIVAGALLFETLTHSLTMQPLMISKVNTAAQIVLAALVLGFNGFGIDDRMAVQVMVPVVAVTTLASGAAYVIKWSRQWALMEDGE